MYNFKQFYGFKSFLIKMMRKLRNRYIFVAAVLILATATISLLSVSVQNINNSYIYLIANDGILMQFKHISEKLNQTNLNFNKSSGIIDIAEFDQENLHIETRELCSNLTKPPNATVVILIWDSLFGDPKWQSKLGFKRATPRSTNQSETDTQCGWCEFTSNRSRITDDVDYVIFEAMSNPLPFPSRLPKQRWVFFTREPPIAGNGWWTLTTFNLTSTYRPDADFPQPYGTCKARVDVTEKINVDDVINRKTGLVTWFVSNCRTRSARENYVRELQLHIPVDIYGRCLDGNNTVCRRLDPTCEYNISIKYKFYLAFENSLCDSYVTEKVFRHVALEFPIVLVVMGNADYAALLPPHSYIDVRWFDSPQSLARYLVYLDRNDTAYGEYFKWRQQYTCQSFLFFNFDSVCQRAIELLHRQPTVVDAASNWTEARQCVTTKDYFSRKTLVPAWLI